MLMLNGLPGSRPSGNGARVVAPHPRHCPAWHSTRVTTGLTFGTSILS
jgi:hypothetical protein